MTWNSGGWNRAVSSPRRVLLLVSALAGIMILCVLTVLLVHERRKARVPAAAATTQDAGLNGARAPGDEDLSPTVVYAHNLRLRQGPRFMVYVRWLRGRMLRTRMGVTPSLDDPESFLLDIDKGVLHVNIGDVSGFLNGAAPKDAPLKNISIQPNGDSIRLSGTVQKIVPLPVELMGNLTATADDRVRFHMTKLNVLKIPVTGLLGGLHLELSDLVRTAKIPGVQIAGDDIIFDSQKLLPPPHIQGHITSIEVDGPDIEVIYGGAQNDESKLSQWHNFLRLTGGTLEFGKLTMNHVDLTMIDASEDRWFDLDLANYQKQLVKGYSRITPQNGLEIFMPDLEQALKNTDPTITIDWLKDRNQSLPAGVPKPE